MQEGHEDVSEVLYKLAIYIPGVIIGLAAKLSRINRGKKLTIREAIYQTTVAFSTAWLVWFGLVYLGYPKAAGAAAVICGRFGDEIMIFAWKYIRVYLKVTIETLIKML